VDRFHVSVVPLKTKPKVDTSTPIINIGSLNLLKFHLLQDGPAGAFEQEDTVLILMIILPTCCIHHSF
jgi:hypothetical protein